MVHVFLHRLALAICPKWNNLADSNLVWDVFLWATRYYQQQNVSDLQKEVSSKSQGFRDKSCLETLSFKSASREMYL